MFYSEKLILILKKKNLSSFFIQCGIVFLTRLNLFTCKKNMQIKERKVLNYISKHDFCTIANKRRIFIVNFVYTNSDDYRFDFHHRRVRVLKL